MQWLGSAASRPHLHPHLCQLGPSSFKEAGNDHWWAHKQHKRWDEWIAERWRKADKNQPLHNTGYECPVVHSWAGNFSIGCWIHAIKFEIHFDLSVLEFLHMMVPCMWQHSCFSDHTLSLLLVIFADRLSSQQSQLPVSRQLSHCQPTFSKFDIMLCWPEGLFQPAYSSKDESTQQSC